MIILGIETSCDETGIAIVRDGTEIISDALVSQIDLHKKFGGVVPELAARQHTESLDVVLDEALSKTEIDLKDIDAIAVTYGPGLPGALLVGIAFAKGLAYSLSKPLIGVNHIEAHLESVQIKHKEEVLYPAIGLVVSGGHTSLFYIKTPGEYKLIGKTRDDAAGEAYDKVAKLLNLGYPGGPIIDKLYRKGNYNRFTFKKPKFTDGSSDFSFSGLKTAALKYVRETPEEEMDDKFITDLAASFQSAAIDILKDAIERAITEFQPSSIIIAGGVAVNSLLREKAAIISSTNNLPVFIPEARLCTDNAIMVASLGYRLFTEGKISSLDLDAKPNLTLGY